MERLEQHPSRPGHVSNRGVKGILVGPGRTVEAADLADELERRVVQLLVGWRVLRMPKPLDVPAHVNVSLSPWGSIGNSSNVTQLNSGIFMLLRD
jgi:hypothetical protein